VVLFSIGLDLFLWLDHDYVCEVLKRFFRQTAVLPELQNPETIRALETTVEEINLFSVLRTFPVGIPSLIASRSTLIMPTVSHSPGVALVWICLCNMASTVGNWIDDRFAVFNVVAQAAVAGQ